MNANEIMTQIIEVREDTIRLLNRNDPGSLTQLSLNNAKIATLNSLLTPKVAEAKTSQIDTEKIVYMEAKEETTVQAAIEKLMRFDKRTIKARERYTKIEMFNKDLWRFLDHVRTHISAMKEEIKQ